MVGRLNLKYAKVVRQQFEFRCLSLIIQAYHCAHASKAVMPTFDEEDITEILNSHLDKNAQRIEWQITTNTENRLYNLKVKKVKGFAKRSARIDLRFTTLTSSMEFRYYMEAKNLKISNSALKRRYIKTGIDNYITAKYNDGFLVGYVLAGKIIDNVAAVNKLLVKDSRPSEIIQISASPIAGYDQYHSLHPSMRIKHLFFDFS